MQKIKIVALIGEAGSGKDTLLQEVIKVNSDSNINEIISCTTRPKREGEKDGVNYYFMNTSDFISGMNDGQFLETSSFNGWYYGTHLDCIDINKINIGVFNPQGIRSLLGRKDIEVLTVYVKTDKKERLLRQLNREEYPNVDEIIRRYLTDEQDFKYLNFPYIELNNDCSLKASTKALLDIINQFILCRN